VLRDELVATWWVCPAFAAYATAVATLGRRLHLGRLPALQDRRHAHAAGGADGDETAAAVLGQQLGQIAEDAGAGGGEGVAEGDAGALDVELGAVDGAQGLGTAEMGLAVLR